MLTRVVYAIGDRHVGRSGIPSPVVGFSNATAAIVSVIDVLHVDAGSRADTRRRQMTGRSVNGPSFTTSGGMAPGQQHDDVNDTDAAEEQSEACEKVRLVEEGQTENAAPTSTNVRHL